MGNNGVGTERSVSRLVLILSALMISGSVAYTFMSYDALPPRIPTHFDLAGRPNDWMDKPLGAWMLPATQVVLSALLFGVSRLVKLEGPNTYINVPYKALIQTLPAQDQRPIWRMAREMTEWLIVVVSAIFTYVQFYLLEAARGEAPASGMWPVLGAIIVALAVVVLHALAIRRAAIDAGNRRS